MSYSSHDPFMFDAPSRLAQAQKIARVTAHFVAGRAASLRAGSAKQSPRHTEEIASSRPPLLAMTRRGGRALDIGCSSGIITRALAARWGDLTGVDVDRAALASAVAEGGVRYAAASGMALPFAAETFDIAVCNQVYQYVPDVPGLVAEIARVLRPGGICYFSARNLWGIVSRENRKPLVAAYAPALARGGEWTRRAGALWSYRRLRALTQQHFTVHDYTTRVLSDPALSDLFVPARGRAWLAHMPQMLLNVVKPMLPTHIWVLEK